jgi:hypothetical protein
LRFEAEKCITISSGMDAGEKAEETEHDKKKGKAMGEAMWW